MYAKHTVRVPPSPCSSARISLQDLDADALLCITRRVPSGDWFLLAMQSRSLRSACRQAYIERHRTLFGKEPAEITFRTAASESKRRLEGWAVPEMGYRPDYRTLRDIAFRGDCRLFKHVSRKWRLDRLGDLPLDIYRSAGASGDSSMIQHVFDATPRPHNDEALHVLAEYVRRLSMYNDEVLFGLVEYDREANFAHWFPHLTRDNDGTFAFAAYKLIPACIYAGSERLLPVLLDKAEATGFRAALTTATEVWFKDAFRAGRVCILETLFRRYGGSLSSALRASLAEHAFPVPMDFSWREWMSRWNPEDFRPVDHFAVFRFMCEEMQLLPVPSAVVTSAIRHNHKAAIEYMHRKGHHPVETWTTEQWALALTEFEDTGLATFAFRLGRNVPLRCDLIHKVVKRLNYQYRFSDLLMAEHGSRVLSWLLERNVMWRDEWETCVTWAVAHGNVSLVRWMLERGAPMDTNTILNWSTEILALSVSQPRGPGLVTNLEADAQFRTTVTFLLEECNARWSSSCILTASGHRYWVPDGYDIHEVLMWMVEKGAPVDHEDLEPSFVRNVQNAAAVKQRRLALRSASS